MNIADLEDKLKQLDIEDFIWVIYIGIIILSWISNHYERDFFLTQNKESKEIYRNIMIIIFSILLVVYLYFLKDSFDDIKNINSKDTSKSINLKKLSFIGSLLIAISGIIFLYIAYADEELNVEIAFN